MRTDASQRPVDVFLTVDTEASIGGCFADPVRNKPFLDALVDGRVDDRSEALGFLLRTLREHRLRGTFFVESLQSRYFGHDPMRRYVDAITDAGQDVQLHVHPAWRNFRDGAVVRTEPADHSTGRPAEELEAIFAEAIERFEAWGHGGPAAVRTGSFSVGLDTYHALEAVGLSCASNVSLALNPSADAALHWHYHYRQMGSVREVPLTAIETFSPQGRRVFRPLTVTACSFAEFRAALQQAWEQDFDMLCLLTHPFEFVVRKGDGRRPEGPQRTNQRRFRRLCEFLAQNRDRFNVTTFGDFAARPALPEAPAGGVLRGSYTNMLMRSAANLLADRLA